jgi:pimeloyl-ACP methyl ester carboxylesterase
MALDKNTVRSVDVPSGEAVIEARVVGDGPPVVLLAGHSRGVSDFVELMDALGAAGHQAVGINIRGAEGSSGPFDKLTTEMMVEDIEAVVQALGLGRFHILGHALGSRLARYFATCRPEAVRTVILLAAGGRQVVPVDHTRLAEAITRTLAGTISAGEMDQMMHECRLVAPGNDPRRVRTGWWPNVTALVEAWKHITLDDYISAGGRPTLVLFGAEDAVTPVPNVHALKDELGDQVRLVEIAGAGHCMQMERPREVQAAVLDWLSGHRNT